MNGDSKVPLALTIPEVSEGVYQGTSQYGLSLVGGNIKEIKLDQIRVVAHADVLNGAKATIEKYQKGWGFIEDWLEVPMMPSVIYILNNEHYYQTLQTPNQEFLVWDINALQYDDTVIAGRVG